MSPNIQRLSLSKRFYSTGSVDKNFLNIDNTDINESIKFDSLEQGCEEIKLNLIYFHVNFKQKKKSLFPCLTIYITI